jgi:hypothetical protein
MARTIAYAGRQFQIAYARERSGHSPGAEFFNGLSKDDKAKLMYLFRLMGDEGAIRNKEKLGTLGEGLFEFRSFQIRMPFGYAKERGVILITHGFVKKRDKAPKEEIARARRILQEDQEGTGLAIIKRRGV